MSDFKSIAWNDLHDDFKDPEFAYEFGKGVRDFYRKQGAEAKQKRIIKLLESKLCWCVGQPLNEENGREELMKHMNCDWEAMMIEYHVALIKGEK